MPICLETAQQLVKEHHLARRLHQAIHCIQVFVIPTILLLCRAEEEGVVAALLELNDDVQQRDLRPFALQRQSIMSDMLCLGNFDQSPVLQAVAI